MEMEDNLNKYIVYITTNLVNGKVYVGCHKTENPYVFDGYYGLGINIKDQSKLKHPKYPFHYALKKYGFKNFMRSTIKIYDTLEEALRLEALIVDEEFIKRKDTYNVALGGSAPPVKEIITYLFDLLGNLLNEYSSILAASKVIGIDDSAIGYAIKNKTTSGGFLWATTDSIDIKYYNNTLLNKKVYLYTLDGEPFKYFESLSECARFLEMDLGPVLRAYWLNWKVGNYYITDKLLDCFLPKRIDLQGEYHQYNLQGEYIKTFKNRKELMEEFGCNMDGINQSIRMGKPYKEFLWCRGIRQSKLKAYELKKKIRKVGQYSLDGTLVKTFNSVREARLEFSNVNKVLKGTANLCKGYTFKYLD